MKIYFADLHPCNTRKVNVRQAHDFIESCDHEIVDKAELAEMIMVWGCEFRGDWRDFSYAVIKELQEKYPKAKMIYIGCTFGGEYVSKIESQLGITVVPWNDRSEKLEKVINEHQKKLSDQPLKLAEDKLVNSATEHRKTHPLDNVCFEDEYVKLSICEGCNNNCTYCSEKRMFPPFRSFPEDQLIKECKKSLEDSKTNQIMFLADSTGEYGRDIGSSVPQLIRRLRGEIGNQVIVGMSQLNPEHFIKYENEMIKLIEEGAITYLNIPIQSANDRILKSMRRNYTKEGIERVFRKFKKIGFENFSTHLLLGYPGEKVEDVEESIDFIVNFAPKHVVVSAFMTHPSIPASLFPNQIDKKETDRRIQMCVDKFTEKDIKVAADWGAVTNRIMNRIRHSVGLSLLEFQTIK